MNEQPPPPEAAPDEEELGTEIDPLDPQKRDPEEGETMPGLDPVVSPVPPE